MNQETSSPNIVLGASWGEVRLGDTMEEVQNALDRMGFTKEVRAGDDYVWVTDNPYLAFYFQASTSRLAQILIADFPATVNGSEILGLRIDEGLRLLNVRSFSDTLWSGLESDDEFENGVPVADQDRPVDYTTMEKLRYGLLWIRNLGVGLGMNEGHIGEIVLRLPASIPTKGCGPLSESDLLEVTGDTFHETIAIQNAKFKESVTGENRLISLLPYLPAAIFLIVLVGYFLRAFI